MEPEGTNLDPKALEALLDLYASSGVDAVLDETPHDRFKEGAEEKQKRQMVASTSIAAPAPSSPARQDISQTQPKAAPSKSPSEFLKSQQGGMPASPSASQNIQQPAAVPDKAMIENARAAAQSAKSLDELRVALQSFDGCNLKRTAKNLCFADGNPEGRVMIIGEAPGRDEDIQGLPFVGRSGQLLDKMLASIGLSRQNEVYIANVVPWRPPGNRTPTPQETEICRPFIERQIELANPDIILLMGGSAAKQMLGKSEGILRLRGKFHLCQTPNRKFAAMASLHPAYLLRQPAQKKLAWQDLIKTRKFLAGEIESGLGDLSSDLL